MRAFFLIVSANGICRLFFRRVSTIDSTQIQYFFGKFQSGEKIIHGDISSTFLDTFDKVFTMWDPRFYFYFFSWLSDAIYETIYGVMAYELEASQIQNILIPYLHGLLGNINLQRPRYPSNCSSIVTQSVALYECLQLQTNKFHM
jgi:hypothetical protein